MKILVYFFFLIASFLLNADTKNEYEIKNYFIDYSYLKEFSPRILGIYVIKGDIPIKIVEDTHIMSQILSRYIVTRFTGSKTQSSEYEKLISEKLFNKFSHKHYNYHTELRDLDLIIRDNQNDANILYLRINEFVSKKRDFYLRQNNHDGVTFCNDIEKNVLKILLKLIHDGDDEKQISSMSKTKLKSFWLDFKKNNYPIIQKYFETKADELISLDNDTFELKVKANESNKLRYYYISINMFGQTWYLEIYDDYVSELNNISLIQL